METKVYHDPELGDVSWEIVYQTYENLSNPSEDIRRHANKWLVKFYESEHSK